MKKPMAELTGDVFEAQDAECPDSHYFLLKHGGTEFLFGMENVLECLKFAEANGVVPKLPNEWWSAMFTAYPDLKEPVDVDSDVENMV